VLKKEFIKLIDDDATVLEQAPMINAANKGEMMAFKHDGFWQCMDTKRDVDYLNDIWSLKENKWNFIS
jgi:glucose-1-phosphate cytidylyltransferase